MLPSLKTKLAALSCAALATAAAQGQGLFMTNKPNVPYNYAGTVYTDGGVYAGINIENITAASLTVSYNPADFGGPVQNGAETLYYADNPGDFISLTLYNNTYSQTYTAQGLIMQYNGQPITDPPVVDIYSYGNPSWSSWLGFSDVLQPGSEVITPGNLGDLQTLASGLSFGAYGPNQELPYVNFFSNGLQAVPEPSAEALLGAFTGAVALSRLRKTAKTPEPLAAPGRS